MRMFLAGVSLFMVVGCAGPSRLAATPLPFAIPAAWTGGPVEADAVEAQWWRQFGDEKLNVLIEEAIRANPDLRQTAARLDAAASQLRLAAADLMPQIGLAGAASRAGFSGQSRGSFFVGDTRSAFSSSLSVNWEMDLWGRLSARKRSAVRAAEASLADFDAARLSLIAQTARAYFRLVEARMQENLSAQTVASFRDAAQLVRDRYRRSLRPAVDLRLAQAQLAESEALLARRRRELDAAARQLELLLGRYPRAEPDAAADLSKLPPPIPAGLPSALLARRPDIIAAFKRLRASDARIDAARADLYPRLSLTASGGYTSDELKNLLTGDASVWNLVANLVQPLFNGGRLRAAVQLTEARGREALAAYVGTVLRAFAEVETVLAIERHQQEEEKHRAQAVTEAAAARRLAEARYRRGLQDFVTVLVAQRQEWQARSALLTLRRGRLDNRVNLHLALGGPFAARANGPQASGK